MTVSFEYEEDGGVTNKKMQWTLSEKGKGSGLCTWDWNDNDPNPKDLGFCQGFRNYLLEKKSDSTQFTEEDGGGDDFCFIASGFR